MKILTSHQPVYLPWCGLIHKIAVSDAYVVFDTVQYLKEDWNSRNKIKTSKGPLWLTVPVYTYGKIDIKLQDLQIDNKRNWKKKHLRSIEYNYSKTLYYDKYISFFRELYSMDWVYLAELNDYILRFILKDLNIHVDILYGHDLDLTGKKSDLVLDMCKKVKPDIFLFGALGKNYANADSFHNEGIAIDFQSYNHPVYPQKYGPFEPYMTVFDLMFNCGEKSYEILMSGNISKQELMNKLLKE